MEIANYIDLLQCPISGNRLSLRVASNKQLTQLTTIPRAGESENIPVGPTSQLLLIEKTTGAYPIIDGFPILLAPEKLVPISELNDTAAIDLTDPRYEEAYQEMAFYNAVHQQSESYSIGELQAEKTIPSTFPQPEEIWLDAPHDALSQLEAYEYLKPIKGKSFLQLGGSGTHAVKLLIAGAEKAFLLTPMIDEARYASRLAKHFGVADRLGCVIAVGEEIPFRQDSLDLIYSGGCIHHMNTQHVFGEIHRVLKNEGKFTAVDPWKTILHTIGTSALGKREKSVFCKPLTEERMAPLEANFKHFVTRHHGPLLRYFFIGLEKAGFQLSVSAMLKIANIDEFIGNLPGVSAKGGSLMMGGTKV